MLPYSGVVVDTDLSPIREDIYITSWTTHTLGHATEWMRF